MSSEAEQYCGYADENEQDIRIDSPTDTSEFNRYSMYRMDEGEEEGAVGYYGESEELAEHHDGRNDEDEDDVYAQLAQKEKDLILAAELGKALLESNDELRRKQEQIQHDYAEKMETLEQERYELKLRLESLEGQYKDKMMDVQSEIMLLQNDLSDQQEAVRLAEKEKQEIVQELSDQNQRLSSQLQQAASTEEDLTEQIQKLRLQLNDKKSSMTNNSHLLDRLREEVQLLTDRKCELERRLNVLIEDRDSMACNLEEANDRVMMLERQVRESEQQLYNKDAEINELRQMNSHLQGKVDELSEQSLHQTTDSPSLFEELESQLTMDTSDIEMEPRHGRYSVEDIESDDEVGDYGMVFSRPQSQAQDDFEKEQLKAINEEMKIMIHKSCSHLREILKDLRRNYSLSFQDDEDDIVRRMLQRQDKIEDEDDNGGSESNDGDEDDEDDDDFRPENLKEVIEEIRTTVQEIMQRQLLLSTASGISNMSLNRTKEELAELETKIQSLELDLQSTQDHMGKLQTAISKQDNELVRRSSVIDVLNSKARQSVADNASLLQLNDSERQVDMLQEERHRLQQQHQEDMIRHEENVQKAKAERDEAVAKKNATELELTRAKIDMMNLDSQLLEAIQQKIELSQQLDQWQIDMEELLGIRMQKKLTEDENNSTVITPDTRKKKKSFWS